MMFVMVVKWMTVLRGLIALCSTWLMSRKHSRAGESVYRAFMNDTGHSCNIREFLTFHPNGFHLITWMCFSVSSSFRVFLILLTHSFLSSYYFPKPKKYRCGGWNLLLSLSSPTPFPSRPRPSPSAPSDYNQSSLVRPHPVWAQSPPNPLFWNPSILYLSSLQCII